MSSTTRPFFIVSSGRSGTAMLHKVLSAEPTVEMHHEYMVHIVQPLAVKRYMGWIGSPDAARVLGETHCAAIRYSDKTFWGDSSNKLSWLIPELSALLPDAKFVHLVRDGRKVASSYFHKLGQECYDDRSTATLATYARHREKIPAPPPEKKYWWPLGRPGDSGAARFEDFNQFERIAWHWAEINRVILDAVQPLPEHRKTFVRLEDLESDAASVRHLFEFLGLGYRNEHAQMFARPHNINRPEDRLLDPDQTQRFERIASPMMRALGYAGKPEYVVNY
ncbi:MAG: sulfotransferase [Rhizomicrobium sp.]